jgi:hypothetical protein
MMFGAANLPQELVDEAEARRFTWQLRDVIKKDNEAVLAHTADSVESRNMLSISEAKATKGDYHPLIPDTLKKLKARFDVPKPVDQLLACSGLLSAIVNVMAAVYTFRSTIPSTQRDRVPYFDTWLSIAMYFPLCFAPLVFNIFHNALSVQSFFNMLNHGILLKVPDAGIAGAIKFLQGKLFVAAAVLYYLLICALLLYFTAVWSIWLLLANQFFLGIVMLWRAELSIDGHTISLVEFIEAFDERDDDEDDAAPDASSEAKFLQEAVSWRRSVLAASVFLQDMKVAVSPKPSYTAFVAKYCQRFDYSVLSRYRRTLRFVIALGCLVLCGLAVWSLQTTVSDEIGAFWDSTASPCIQVCADFARQNNVEGGCGTCICQCLTILGRPELMDTCETHIAAPQCIDQCSEAVCSR